AQAVAGPFGGIAVGVSQAGRAATFDARSAAAVLEARAGALWRCARARLAMACAQVALPRLVVGEALAIEAGPGSVLVDVEGIGAAPVGHVDEAIPVVVVASGAGVDGVGEVLGLGDVGGRVAAGVVGKVDEAVAVVVDAVGAGGWR